MNVTDQPVNVFAVTLAHGSFLSVYTQNGFEVTGTTWHNSVEVDRETQVLFATEAALSAYVRERQQTLRTKLAAEYVPRTAM